MPPSEIDDEQKRMLARLGWDDHPLWKAWAKIEIAFGLLAVASGFIGAARLAVVESRTQLDAEWTSWAGHAALIVLGGYLALAGHRSHLYQSNNRLTAYLADLIRSNTRRGNDQ